MVVAAWGQITPGRCPDPALNANGPAGRPGLGKDVICDGKLATMFHDILLGSWQDICGSLGQPKCELVPSSKRHLLGGMTISVSGRPDCAGGNLTICLGMLRDSSPRGPRLDQDCPEQTSLTAGRADDGAVKATERHRSSKRGEWKGKQTCI